MAAGNPHVPARFDHGYSGTGAAVEYPDDPVTTAEDFVTNQTQLDAAIAAGNGRKINVAAGSYTSLNIFVNRTDLDIVMDNAAVFSGGIAVGHSSGTTVSRIRASGGVFNDTGLPLFVLSNSSHLMFDNIRWAGGLLLSNFSADLRHHIALKNCSATSNNQAEYALFWPGTQHLIVVRCDLQKTGTGFAAGTRGYGKYAIFAGNRVASNNNRVIRTHADTSGDSELMLWTNEQWEGYEGEYNLWWGPEVGVDHSNSMYRIELHGCRYYNETAGLGGFVAQTDSTTNTPGIDDFIVRNCTFYSPDSAPFTGNPPSNFDESIGNTYPAYTTPPAYSGGADH